jgi:predicted Rossmann fold nucleotide-binding protein DprA/Smf involved in DNA uptake
MSVQNAPGREAGSSREVREIVRDEITMHGRILDALRDGPLTIPEIARAIDCPSHEVVFWVMGMRRYGWLSDVKGTADDGFFRYQAEDRG